MAWRCFNRNVLRIQTSEFNEIAKEHSSGTKESFPRSSEHSTPWIRRSTEGQVGHMMEFEEFHDWRTVGKAQWTSEKQIRCADAQWTLDNDSQSSPASLKKLKLEE